MKLIIILAAASLAQAAKLDRIYLPPNTLTSAGSANFLKTPTQSSRLSQIRNGKIGTSYSGATQNAYTSEGSSQRAQAAFERNAAILRQDNSNDGETYSYAYETENGIVAEESGVATNGVQAQGGYSYTGDDGKVYSVRYTADENGFIPQGDHLPTSPPIPEEILKALEQNARDEAAGIYDDGTYKADVSSSNSQQQYYNTKAQLRNNNINTGAIQKTYLPPAQKNNFKKNGY